MCNIAGYTGNKKAAEVLAPMMQREEGFSGGYYTGLAAVSGGKIRAAKCTGDLQFFMETMAAAEIPGTTGIIHSRSDSGGGTEWAHPFLSGPINDPEIAYVANGYAGRFADPARDIKVAERLLSEGFSMSSRVNGEKGYTTLGDGSSVHMSDVMCQLIAEYYRKGIPLSDAMAKAFCEMPQEVVGLCISKESPDRIYFSRFNFPMFAAFASHGAYLASTPLAFPQDAEKILEIPMGTSGYVTKNSLHVNPVLSLPVRLEEADAELIGRGYEAVVALLGNKEADMSDISHLLKPMFPGTGAPEAYQLGHRILWSLQKKGALKQRVIRVPGAGKNLTAPKIMLSIDPLPV